MPAARNILIFVFGEARSQKNPTLPRITYLYGWFPRGLEGGRLSVRKVPQEDHAKMSGIVRNTTLDAIGAEASISFPLTGLTNCPLASLSNPLTGYHSGLYSPGRESSRARTRASKP